VPELPGIGGKKPLVQVFPPSFEVEKAEKSEEKGEKPAKPEKPEKKKKDGV